MATADLLITHASELITLKSGPRHGSQMDDLEIVRDGALAIKGARIVAMGPSAEVVKDFAAPMVVSAEGRCVLPGFVDAHTHPIFADYREQEFDQRLRGLSYQEIARRGGGIMASVRGVRTLADAELRARLKQRANGFLRHGTTTIEAKSGYGLSADAEIRSLEALRDVARDHPLEMVATFLGAHECPPEFGGLRGNYLAHLASDVLPRVREQSLAEYCDIFCDVGVFSPDESIAYLTAARDLGFKLRVHADELADFRRLARGRRSTRRQRRPPHLHDQGGHRAAQGAARVSPILLPGTVLSLGMKRLPDARGMIDAGLPVVIASDFNPGTCPTQSMPAMIALACQMLRMTVAEAIAASTINAAASLGRERSLGSLAIGKQADVVILSSASHLSLVTVWTGTLSISW
ncbi:MAG: imidazolonepropionase [Planctomycetota bacterium]